MKILLLIISMCVATTTQAAIVINEYTNPILDSTFLNAGRSHVDTTTNLEWLDFNDNNIAITTGHSITSAITAYSPQGWRLATPPDVASLFKTFFPSLDAASDYMIVPEDKNNTIIQSRNSWLYDFGSTPNLVNGILTQSLLSVGAYINDNNTVQLMGVKLNKTQSIFTKIYGPKFTVNFLSKNTRFNNIGIFMVRNYIPSVPIPGAIWLFCSGLIIVFSLGVQSNNNILIEGLLKV